MSPWGTQQEQVFVTLSSQSSGVSRSITTTIIYYCNVYGSQDAMMESHRAASTSGTWQEQVTSSSENSDLSQY